MMLLCGKIKATRNSADNTVPSLTTPSFDWSESSMADRTIPKLWTEAEDAVLRSHYLSHTRDQIAYLLGRTCISIRSRCSVLGLNHKHRAWTQADLEVLREWYTRARDVSLQEFDLDGLSARLGRLRTCVSKKAKELGLTKQGRSHSGDFIAWTSARQAARIKERGHPRGALGMKHSEEMRAKMGRMSRDRFKLLTPDDIAKRQAKIHQTKLARYGVAGGAIGASNPYSRAKRGRREDLGGIFFRSSWEANYARYLNFLKSRGEILDWEYEPRAFVFHGVTRGAVTYTPDFRVIEKDQSHAWHEVKGWMDGKSKTKLKRFAQFYPDERMVVIDQKVYKAIEKFSRLIPNWE